MERISVLDEAVQNMEHLSRQLCRPLNGIFLITRPPSFTIALGSWLRQLACTTWRRSWGTLGGDLKRRIFRSQQPLAPHMDPIKTTCGRLHLGTPASALERLHQAAGLDFPGRYYLDTGKSLQGGPI